MDRDKLIRFISIGGEITGGIVGGLVGSIAGPAGIVGGGIAGTVISKGVAEMAERMLSDREKIRIAASSTYILASLKIRLESGDEPRNDSFFTDSQYNRSNANELFEGVLLKCREAYEERKIQFISKIFENTVFDVRITSEVANQILNIANRITYRQFCILSLTHKNQSNQLESTVLSNIDYRDEDRQTLLPEKNLLFQDYHELASLGLIKRSDDIFVMEALDVIPSRIRMTYMGQLFVDLTRVDTIDTGEINFISLVS